MSRSYEKITVDDLGRLNELAAKDRKGFFKRNPDTGTLYRDRYFATALCQGAALHYLGGVTGVKDFDVWSFYTEALERPYPYRRRGKWDFGSPKFGVTPGFESFIGRRVDMLGRSLVDADPRNPLATLRDYLSRATTKSSRFLAAKAVILLDPPELFGTVVWPLKAQQGAAPDRHPAASLRAVGR